MTIDRFDGELAANILARTPIIGIDYRNTDRESVFEMITAMLTWLKRKFCFLYKGENGSTYFESYSLEGQPKKRRLNSSLPKTNIDLSDVALKYVSRFIGNTKELASPEQEVFVFFADDSAYDADYLIELAEKSHKLKQTIIILFDDFSLEDEHRLKKWGFFIDHWLPNEEELAINLKEFWQNLKFRSSVKFELDDEEFRRIAALFVGYGFLEAQKKFMVFTAKQYLEDYLNEKPCIIDKSAVDKFEMEMKAEFCKLENSPGLEKVSVDNFDMNSVVGLENLKQWLETRKKLSSPKKIGEMKLIGIDPPRGVLLAGVPGCGKSLSAKCIAASFGLPLYRLDFATIQNCYIGESEQNLKRAFDFVDSRSPCILWIDEIEKGLDTRNREDTYTKKLLGMFLFYLQENKTGVFIVATANDVQVLPAELLRKGRFDEIFFVDLPNQKERKEILKKYLKKYLKINLSENFSKEIVAAIEGFTPSDIESTLKGLAYKKIVGENPDISEKGILKLFKESSSLSKVNPEKVEEIRAWGMRHAIPASSIKI